MSKSNGRFLTHSNSLAIDKVGVAPSDKSVRSLRRHVPTAPESTSSAAQPNEQFSANRKCQHDDCLTRLSIYNANDVCGIHTKRADA